MFNNGVEHLFENNMEKTAKNGIFRTIEYQQFTKKMQR